MAHYLLRVTPVLVAGWSFLIVAAMLPSLLDGSSEIRLDFDILRILQSPYFATTYIAVFMSVFVAMAASLFATFLQAVIRNRFLIALAAGGLAVAGGAILCWSMGATTVGVVFISAMFGWAGFISAVASQVGRLSSYVYAVVTPSVAATVGALASGILVQAAAFAPTACEQRQSPARERCIIQEEQFDAWRLAWEKKIKTNDTSMNTVQPEAALRQSVRPATERMLKAALADCEKLSPPENDPCRHDLWKMQNEAPGMMLERVEKSIADRNAQRQRSDTAAKEFVRKKLIERGADGAALDRIMEIYDLIPEERRKNPTAEDVRKAVEELKARQLNSQ